MMDEKIPGDPAMMLSFVNMKLRDAYSSLDALCDDMALDRRELERKMAQAGWEYNPQANKFW